MKKEEIHFGDVSRWLFGNTPPEFMIEVFIRTLLIFLFLFVAVRLMGSRMAGQITLTELAVMITLGGIVSPVMQLPDRGLVFGCIGLLVALAFQRGLNYLSFKNQKIENVAQGTLSIVIQDGVVNVDALHKTSVTVQQLFAMLREKKILNLAFVERAYLEACGVLSIYERKDAEAGLPVSPSMDEEILSVQQKLDSGLMACCRCGNVQKVKSRGTTCEICKGHEWSHAYALNETL